MSDPPGPGTIALYSRGMAAFIIDELELTERTALYLDDEANGFGPIFDLLVTGKIVNSGETHEVHIPDILTIEPTPITPRRYQRLDALTHWLATGLRTHPAHAPHPPLYPIPGPQPHPHQP